MCLFASLVSTPQGDPDAPEAGQWFDYAIKQLASNAVWADDNSTTCDACSMENAYPVNLTDSQCTGLVRNLVKWCSWGGGGVSFLSHWKTVLLLHPVLTILTSLSPIILHRPRRQVQRSSASSSSDCEAACCSEGTSCNVWQWCEGATEGSKCTVREKVGRVTKLGAGIGVGGSKCTVREGRRRKKGGGGVMAGIDVFGSGMCMNRARKRKGKEEEGTKDGHKSTIPTRSKQQQQINSINYTFFQSRLRSTRAGLVPSPTSLIRAPPLRPTRPGGSGRAQRRRRVLDLNTHT